MRHLLCPALPRPPVPPRPRAPRPPGSPPPPGRGRARAAPAAASAAPAPARVPGRLIRPGSAPRAARPRPEVMAAVPADLGPVPQSWPPFSGREPGPLARLNPAEPRTPCPCTGGRGPASPPWGGAPLLAQPRSVPGQSCASQSGRRGLGGDTWEWGECHRVPGTPPLPQLGHKHSDLALRLGFPICKPSRQARLLLELGFGALGVTCPAVGGGLLRGWGWGSGSGM